MLEKRNRTSLAITLALAIVILLGAVIWAASLEQVAATSIYPAQKDRLGFGHAPESGAIDEFPAGVAQLNAGWYTDWRSSPYPSRPNGIEYAQLVKIELYGWTRYDTESGLAGNTVYAIAIDGTNHQWFGSNAGVSELNNGSWSTYDTADGLANNIVRAVAIDLAGNLWFGTDGGVSKFSGSTWTTYNTGDGLAGNRVRAIAVDLTGNLWFGTNAGVSKFDGVSTWTTFNTGNGLAGNTVYAIAVDTGDLWFGTNAGVSKFDGISTWATYNTGSGLISNKVQAILADGTDKWFATDGGISVFDGSTWTTHTMADGLLSDDVRAMTIDGGGNVWCGTMGGANKFDGTLWSSYPAFSQPTPNLGSNYVYAVAVDPAQRKWFGTDSGGVSRFDEPGFWNYLAAVAAAQPGSVWILGNEPDGPQDVYIPTIYAQRYHEFHTFVKGADPTAQIAVAPIVQGTPLRIQWLDDMYHAYQDRYGVPIPVDIWSIHEQILREDYNSFGCRVPVRGITYRYTLSTGAVVSRTADLPLYCKDTLGNVEYCDYDAVGAVAPGQTRVVSNTDYDGSLPYEQWDNANYDLFVEHIERYREWMFQHGQQDKPLIIAEQGVLYKPDRLKKPFETEAEAHQRALDYMRSTFQYMLSTTSESRGYPADGYRLVQRWAWYSLNLEPINFYGPLLEHDTGALTDFGHIFAEFTNNAEPQTGSVVQIQDSAMPAATHLITATYSDPDGFADLDYVYLLINETPSQRDAVQLRYDIKANRLSLARSDDTGWLPSSGGYAPGSPNIVQSTYAVLDAQQCRVQSSGNTLMVTWAIQFKSPLLGNLHNVYLKAQDWSGMFDGWNLVGDVFVGAKVTPNSGWGQPGETQHFVATYDHPGGSQFIRYVEMIINDDTDPTRCLAVRYDVVNDLFYLHHAIKRTVWRPSLGRPAADGGIIKHFFAILDVGQSSVIIEANRVTVDWAVQFKWKLSGKSHNIFMDMEDTTGARVGWHDYGDFVVNRKPNYLIEPTDLSPRNGIASVSELHWFDPAYRDVDGEPTLDELYFLIADSLPSDDAPDAAVPPGVYLRYKHNGNVANGKLYIWGGAGWLGPYDPYDTRGPVETTNAKWITRWSKPIYADFQTIKVFWRLGFKAPFLGKHKLYMRAIDTMGKENGGDTGWKFKGTVTIQ